EWNVVLATVAMQMYSGMSDLVGVRRTFIGSLERDIVAWNTLISALVFNGHCQEALEFFPKMPEWSIVSWNLRLNCYAQVYGVDQAKRIFDAMPAQDITSWNLMATAYARTMQLDRAVEILKKIPARNMASWNLTVAAHAGKGDFYSAVECFSSMPEWDLVSLNTMIAIHAQKLDLQSARDLFDCMPKRDLVTWNTMIHANATMETPWASGNSIEIMAIHGVLPHGAAMLSVLKSCAHSGSLPGAWKRFLSMAADRDIPPSREHYCAMIHILASAGQLDEAHRLINSMPYSSDYESLAAMLGACKLHQDVGRGMEIADQILDSE
ncbi:hypothetical protein SELMODRAFT_55007, partial [Selaginella moellendorffii]